MTVTDVGGQRTSSTFTTTTPANFPWLWVAVAVVAALVALVALGVVRRRRGVSRAPMEPPVEEGGGPTPLIAAGPFEAAPDYLETPTTSEWSSP
ncbi:MAG: hypothetical protein ACHQ0I_04755, partial [Candidatus Lutacidiplasmatales archaeon]